MNSTFKEKLTERFFRYSEIPSQSDPANPVVPSSQGQWEMAELLREELEGLGLQEVTVDQHGIVYGHLPSRLSPGHGPVHAVGWCCHMDTVAVGLSPEVHPLIIRNYQGGDILQNPEKQLYIRVAEHPELRDYVGQDIIVSDGTSVLGADNKAAVANIMTALEILCEDPSREHGDIYVAFTPDEETGLRGAKLMDFTKFPVDFAYTIDCCQQGEVIYETFNAGEAVLNVTGVSAHPMSAKNVLVNACTVMRDFADLLDKAEVPEHTELREGYLWVSEMYSDGVTGKMIIDIRDHDRAKYQYRKRVLSEALEMVRLKYPRAEITLDVKDIYGNILDYVTEENRECVDLLLKAVEELGIEPKIKAMRGGTDGSFISTKGIPTPNYFTGALNFHSSNEFLPLDAFENALKVTLKLVELIASPR